MRLSTFGLLIALALAVPAPSPTAVRVWQDTLVIPTYGEGPANPNPPFDLFSFGRFNYPYPMRDALRARATVGEVCNVLREEWGEHDRLRSL